ncbi:hypothetical protein H5410_047433 [Solanum commersonii]|uniref:Uncharacterized protein n=1 Tax=Solanum commersonii TaxID=4109 RepID=A0A9J5XHA4_SOLCO|nr:hypothetical protein H5410_047433 [Solanum commersonii]
MLISSHLNKQRLTSDQEDGFDRNFLNLQNHAVFKLERTPLRKIFEFFNWLDSLAMLSSGISLPV